ARPSPASIHCAGVSKIRRPARRVRRETERISARAFGFREDSTAFVGVAGNALVGPRAKRGAHASPA
ncbi:MAG: hypothetical protein OXI66_05240, partial [Boseongicola sp.]|nr:hypothetical protein [Boseongicola sp.]